MKKIYILGIGIFLVVVVLAVGIFVGINLHSTDYPTDTQPVTLKPDQEETHAEPIPGDTEEMASSPDGGGNVSLSFSKEVSIGLEEQIAELYFANPGRSNQKMVLQLMIQDVIVAQSGTLSPGNQIKKLDLLDDRVQMLTEGVYEGYFNILYFHPETGEMATVNTTIPVTITVSK